MSDSALERAKRRGQRIGIALFATIMSAFIVVCGSQVIYQGFTAPSAEPPKDCRAGMAALIAALRRARHAAAAEPLGERASLDRFRRALLPEWRQRGAIATTCSGDASAADALSAIDRLRYAEEHAVRYESVDLAPSRRQVLAIEHAIDTPQRGGPVLGDTR